MKPKLLNYNPTELEARVNALFESYSLEDPSPPAPRLFDYAPGSYGYQGYGAQVELRGLMRNLGQDHVIIQEIMRQGCLYLRKLSQDKKLADRNPFYLTALETVGGHGYNILFDEVERASYQVIDQYPLTATVPALEAPVLPAAVIAMLGYTQSHELQVENFLDYCQRRKVVPPFTIRGYCDLKNVKAISAYFDYIMLAHHQNIFPTREEIRGKMCDLYDADLLIDGVLKGINLKFVGKEVQRTFPNNEFGPYYHGGQVDPRIASFLDEKVFKD